MKKGFTLIELLAVIVILAIIALIATPIVLNIINDTKESATLRSAEFYLDAVEHSIATAILKNKNISDDTYNIKDGDICLNDDCTDKLEVEVDGKTPEIGTITITNGKVSDVELTISNKEIWKNPTTGNIEIKVLAPGLYDENWVLLKSWDELNTLALEKTESFGTEYDFGTLIEFGFISDENGEKDPVYAFDIIHSIVEADKLVKLVIDDSVTVIGYWAFFGCDHLTSVIIPDSVETIDFEAFNACVNLTSITIPNSVKTIEEGAFRGCIELTSITIPNSVTSIGLQAFFGCTGLTSITISDSETSIGNEAFSFTGLTSITIPGSVKSIGDFAFSSCKNLTSITIPDNVTMGEDVFLDCTALTTIYYNGTDTSYPWGAPNIPNQ